MQGRAFSRSAASFIGLAATMAACGISGPSADSAVSTLPATNIVDELVRRTVESTGLDAPIEVIEVREGSLDALLGLTPEAQAQASVDPRASGRRDLGRRAWRIRIIGGDSKIVCVTEPCDPPRVYVEAYLDGETHTVIGTSSGPIPAEYASDAP